MSGDAAPPIRLDYRSAPVPQRGWSDAAVFVVAGLIVPMLTCAAVAVLLVAGVLIF